MRSYSFGAEAGNPHAVDQDGYPVLLLRLHSLQPNQEDPAPSSRATHQGRAVVTEGPIWVAASVYIWCWTSEGSGQGSKLKGAGAFIRE